MGHLAPAIAGAPAGERYVASLGTKPPDDGMAETRTGADIEPCIGSEAMHAEGALLGASLGGEQGADQQWREQPATQDEHDTDTFSASSSVRQT